jgi:hypothetical protein
MKKILLLMLSLTAIATADDWTKAAAFHWPEQSCPVVLRNYSVRVGWVDGHPRGNRHDCGPLLGLGENGDDLDLEEVLADKGYLVRLHDGTIEARPASSAVALRQSNSALVRYNQGAAARFTHQQAIEARAEALRPRLVASGERYTADTGYVRAKMTITNRGGSASATCTAVGEFVDWYGHPFAQDTSLVPSLEPGESYQLTFFSMIKEDEQIPNGVIKGDKYTCRVSYR